MTAWSANARFALYYAPAESSAWWEAGSAWLGRNAESGAHCPQPQPEELSRELAALTQSPRRYGWHGTLVPPFRLADGVDADIVVRTAAAWAHAQQPFALGVDVAQLGNFVAVRPDNSDGEASMRALAATALCDLHPLRATPSKTDLERRLAAPLTERQRSLLIEWGYPYVFDEFRFHMTLSDSLDDASARDVLVRWWQQRIAALGPLRVDSAALFVEPGPGEPFVLWRRLPFGTMSTSTTPQAQ
ncbi:DUF1045 domain-containing protein [Paraburkholderia phosphatilytica]|uniref:DUF1045 domain-containing protein n=1 Tax=Paraburkholderia phosphatilytica TaxID=2282883 RepID=UPI000E53227B|nr:DUF1045 domain-containing protein [Paraburkholderia phosphatilytica]